MACAPDPYLTVIIEHHEHGAVLRLRGELDVSGRELLESAIAAALECRPPVLTVDVSELTFMDCAGASVLWRAHGTLATWQARLLLSGAQPVVVRMLRLMGLDNLLSLDNLLDLDTLLSLGDTAGRPDETA